VTHRLLLSAFLNSIKDNAFLTKHLAIGIIIVTFAALDEGGIARLSISWRVPNNKTMKRHKVREVIELLIADGWYQIKGGQTSGDHRQFKHPTKPGKVTVRGAMNEVLSQFLLNSIWKQAGWK